jgi:hypothetical protein
MIMGSLVSAWWVKGHEGVAEAAAIGLPEEVPAFFRAGARFLGHCAGDPDRWKNPSCKFLSNATAPDHYLDLEDYEGNELPANRYLAIALLQELKLKPERVGMLPYAIMEHFDRNLSSHVSVGCLSLWKAADPGQSPGACSS